MSESICATRVADVLLRAMGGRCVILRMPTPAAPADVNEQLGLATPLFQDLTLEPVVFRKARAIVPHQKPMRWEMVVSASVIEGLLGSLAYASASLLFEQALGLLVDDELLEIISATAEQAFGRPYAYRLVLRAPLAQIT